MTEVTNGEETSTELAPSDVGMSETAAETAKHAAREKYRDFARGWYGFGKAVAEIRNSEHFRVLGYKDFKAYVVDEFADMDYSVIIRMVNVVNAHGGYIESFLDANPQKALPAYESLYAIQATQKKAEAAGDESMQRKLTSLLKKVMEGEMSWGKLREELGRTKPATEAVPAGNGTTEAEVDGIAAELESEVASESGEEGEVIAESDDRKVQFAKAAELVLVHMKPIAENLKMLQSFLEDDPTDLFTVEFTDSVVSSVDSFYDYVGEFLSKMESISNA